ncbi:MAG: YibE/F family protein [Candidatus Levybacteria bacterium]|nr:YibE/F family protein [Candidatus Levybacteria bacterium]
MKKILLVIFFTAVFIVVNIQSVVAQETDFQRQEHFEAVITKVLENSEIIEEDGNRHPYQRLQMTGTSGKLKNKTFIIENGKLNQVGITEYNKGERVILSISKDHSGKDIIQITDFVRRTPLYLLAAIFVLLTIIIGGKRGASSILGMALTFGLLFLYVLPQLSSGANPFLVTSIASLIIIPVTFFLSHGYSRKTISAIIGTFIALIITGVLAYIFIEQSHLTGFASEEAGFLDVMKEGTIDIRGLLFAGIVIALLGILEDITVSQAAIVYQLKSANNKLTHLELFKRAMDIGRDHIASMANTLILVYAGASLPLLLLFINNPLPFSSVINTEMIAEEIVRTLVASIGLILAVPITTAITALIASFQKTKSAKS